MFSFIFLLLLLNVTPQVNNNEQMVYEPKTLYLINSQNIGQERIVLKW